MGIGSLLKKLTLLGLIPVFFSAPTALAGGKAELALPLSAVSKKGPVRDWWNKFFYRTSEHLEAKERLDQAHLDFKQGSLERAITGYSLLIEENPFSEYAEEAEFGRAHAQFLNGDFKEAIPSLTDFQRHHPTSPQLSFTGYLLAMSYVQQMGTADRDPTMAQKAQAGLETLIQQFPESPFAELAQGELVRCRETLAQHDLGIARFYLNSGNREAARVRLNRVLSEYAETTASVQSQELLSQL